MTICSNFGIEPDGTEVGAEFGIKEEGVAPAVLAGRIGVEVSVAEGTGGATVVAGICVQAVKKTKRRMEKIDRIIDLRVLALGVL